MGRAPCCEKVGLKKGRWTAEEDEILSKYIQEKGEGSWRSLPKNAGLLRCGKSCRLRWINYLRSDVKRGNISAAEEDIIIKLHESFGNRWSLIAGHLPGRTDNEIKNYWNSHLSRRIHCFRRTNKDGASVTVLMDMGKVVGGFKRKVGRTSRSAMKKTLTRNTEIREKQNDNNAPTLLLKDEAQRPIKVPNGERKDTLLDPYEGNGEVLTPSRERLCESFCPQVELDGGILCPNQGMGSVDLGGIENTENGVFSETIERENGILNPHEEIENWLLSLDDSPNEEERESGLLGGNRERDCRVMGASEESEGKTKVDKCCTSMESWFDEFDGLQEKWKDWEWDEMENKTREDVNERWSWSWDSSSWDWDCEGGTVETM